MPGYPKIIHTEEGMRDGLQIESADIPVAAKIRLLNALSETGLREINVGSFVSPKYTPQMAKIDELVTSFTPKPGVRYTYTRRHVRCVRPAQYQSHPGAADGGVAQADREGTREGRDGSGYDHQQCLGLELDR
jgi:hydroxymethylglutaryl-CoA lyase